MSTSKKPIFKAIYRQKIILVPFDRENSGESIHILKIILKNSALSYNHFKVLKSGRVVSALVCETEVVRVMSSAPHSNNLLLHIFLYRLVPSSSFETTRPWKSDFLGSTPLTIFVAVRRPIYQLSWKFKIKLITHTLKSLKNFSSTS